MTGEEAMIRSWQDHHVSPVIDIPGAHNLALYKAWCEVDGIRHMVARPKQGATFMLMVTLPVVKLVSD